MQDSLKESLNLSFDACRFFPALVHAVMPVLNETDDFAERCARTEAILLAHLSAGRLHPPLMNAMADLLQSEGRIRVTELAAHNQLSTRQLERCFQEYTGVSPKKLSDLIRFQYLWQAAAFSPSFDVQDAVLRFGYADQSHLLRRFRRYYGSTLTEALSFARSHVGFVLSPSSGSC